MGKSIPFLEDSEVDIIPTAEEAIEAKKKKKRSKNKIYKSFVEGFVQEMFIEQKPFSTIIETLRTEHGFVVGFETLKDYHEYYYKDLENKATQKLKEKTQEHVNLDNSTVEKLYEKGATYIDFLNNEFDRIKSEIEKYREMLVEETEDEQQKYDASSKMQFTRIILELEEKLRKIREQIAIKLEGPQGFVIKTQEIAKEVLEGVLKITLTEIPKDKLPAVKEKIREFMRRYDEI